MTETDKVKIDFTQLRGFAELARRNGTEDAFIDLALDFALQACAEIERLKDEIEAAEKSIADQGDVIQRLTAAMREADRTFETVGGSTRHYVRDCLLPILDKHGLKIQLKNPDQTKERK